MLRTLTMDDTLTTVTARLNSRHTHTRHHDRQPVVDSPCHQRTDAWPVVSLGLAAFPVISGSSAEMCAPTSPDFEAADLGAGRRIAVRVRKRSHTSARLRRGTRPVCAVATPRPHRFVVDGSLRDQEVSATALARASKASSAAYSASAIAAAAKSMASNA